MSFKVYTDSCSDLPKELRDKYNIGYFMMNVVVKGVEHKADLDWNEFSYDQLYEWVGDTSNHCKTTMVPAQEFEEKLRKELKNGNDVFYMAISNKLSGSLNIFRMVAEDLSKEFPERKIVGYDSLNAVLSEGMMAIKASELFKEGKTVDEVIAYFDTNKNKYNFMATVDTLKYLKEAGRVSAGAAFFGDIIGVKPMIISDAAGHNYVLEKCKGTKAALNRIVEYVKDTIDLSYDNTIYLGQAPAAAENVLTLKAKLLEAIPGINIVEFKIGPIIGTTCGSSLYGCFYYGKEITIVGPDAK